MKTFARESKCYDYYFAHLDTLVRVEPVADAVIILATRDTFSVSRKESFIREIAAEGFIDETFQWFSFADGYAERRVRWLVGFSWLKIDPALTAATSRFVLRLLGGAALLWLGLMAMLFLRAAG